MFRKTATVLAITLVMASLSVARAEDPDQETTAERFHSAVVHWPVEARHHAVPFSEPKQRFYPN